MNQKQRRIALIEFSDRLSSALEGVPVTSKRRSRKNWITIQLESWAEASRTISDSKLEEFRSQSDLGKAQMIAQAVQSLKPRAMKTEEAVDRLLS